MYKAPFRRDFSLRTDVLRIYSPTHCQTCHFAGLNEKTHVLQKESIGLTPTILLVKNHASFLPPRRSFIARKGKDGIAIHISNLYRNDFQSIYINLNHTGPSKKTCQIS